MDHNLVAFVVDMRPQLAKSSGLRGPYSPGNVATGRAQKYRQHTHNVTLVFGVQLAVLASLCSLLKHLYL